MLLVKLPSVFKAVKISFQVGHCGHSISCVFNFTLISIIAHSSLIRHWWSAECSGETFTEKENRNCVNDINSKRNYSHVRMKNDYDVSVHLIREEICIIS